MTWWRNSSRHTDPKAKAAQQQRLKEVVRDFISGCEQRDPALISPILAANVDITVDTGGAVTSPSQQGEGSRSAADLILRVLANYAHLTFHEHSVNGAPGILLREHGVLVGVITVDMRRGAIAHIWIILNPAKTARFDIR